MNSVPKDLVAIPGYDNLYYSEQARTVIKIVWPSTISGGYQAIKVGQKLRRVHHLVMEMKLGHTTEYSVHSGEGITVDHKDGDKTNNTVENLVHLTQRENTQKQLCGINAVSHGIQKRKNGRAFQVQLSLRGKFFSPTVLGLPSTFDDINEAIKARDALKTYLDTQRGEQLLA